MWQNDFECVRKTQTVLHTRQIRVDWFLLTLYLVKFIYSEKATNFCEISTVDLFYVVTVKSTVEISQNFVAFSEYMNFKIISLQFRGHLMGWPRNSPTAAFPKGILIETPWGFQIFLVGLSLKSATGILIKILEKFHKNSEVIWFSDNAVSYLIWFFISPKADNCRILQIRVQSLEGAIFYQTAVSICHVVKHKISSTKINE